MLKSGTVADPVFPEGRVPRSDMATFKKNYYYVKMKESGAWGAHPGCNPL